MANAFVNPPLPRYFSADTSTSSSGSYSLPDFNTIIRHIRRQAKEEKKKEKVRKARRVKVREPILFDIKNLDIKKE